MIYVMRSAAFKGDSYETIIKIGYTGEKSKKSRFDLYLTENPTIQTLYLIPFGTTRDEKNLHRHFKQYLLYGNEWFKDVPEIIEFFENHKTKESLKELEMWKLSSVQKNESSKNRKSNKDKIPIINVSVNIILEGELDRERIKELERYLWYRINDFWDVIRDEFGEYEEEIKRGIESMGNIVVDNIDSSDQLKKEYQYIIDNFDNDNNFERRMKLLCDANKKYPSLFSIYGPYLQNIIPLTYQNYINLLGLQRIGSLNYKEANIIRFIENKDNNINSVPPYLLLPHYLLLALSIPKNK